MRFVTQSEIKKMLDYEAGACGLQIEHELKVSRVATPSMSKGIYFEFMVTGALPRDNKVPKPEKTLKGELTAEYKVIASQAERVQTYFKRMGITYEVGGWWTNPELGIGAHVDLVGESRAMDRFVMDLKYSGLMHNKWEPMGWMWTDYQKNYHAIQAVHYHLVTGLPFYYLVTESKEGGDIRLFKTEFSESMIANHLQLVERTREFLVEMEIGLNPVPEVTRCEGCALYNECNHRAIYPEIKLITL